MASNGEVARPRLTADHIRLAYDERVIVEDLSVEIPDGRITAVVGANACGKSTLLRALARLLRPKAGSVLLDGQEIHSIKTKEVARRLGLLPQSPIAPDGITVADLIARGRSPHQRLLQQWSESDELAVVEAIRATDTVDLADRHVDELSGGQRQRVWIALALAQQTPLLLLDEPTTFLDIAHQVEVLDLVADLNVERGGTVVMVLHDLNQACRYAHHVVAMKDGRIVAAGDPSSVITAELVHEVFGLECVVIPDPVSGTPLVVPAARPGARAPRHPPTSRPTARCWRRSPPEAGMTGLAVTQSVDAELRRDLSEVFGVDGWLTYHVGGPPRRGTWTTPAALLAGAGLDGLVELQRPHFPELDTDLLWVELLASLAMPVVYTASKLVESRHRYPTIDPGTIALLIEFGDHRAWFGGAWYRTPVVQVLPDDPLAGAPRVEVVADIDALVRNMVDDARRFLAPIVDSVRRHVSVAGGLWGLTLDSLLWPCAVQGDDEPPAAPHARVDRLMAAADGSPFARASSSGSTSSTPDRARTELRTSSCCLRYKWPHDDETPRADGGDPRWNAYCMLCPLIPPDESIHRARWWIDHPT